MLNEIIKANVMVFMSFWYIEPKVQFLEMIWMLNELIQANKIVFKNFWYIEH